MLHTVILMALLSAPASLQAPLQPYAFFEGTWDGEVQTQGKTVRVRYTLAPALDGAFLRGTADFQALGLKVEDFWGVDPGQRVLVRSVFQNNGYFGQVRSAGWKDDVLVFEGSATGVQLRETITRKGPDRFEAVWESKTGDGAWTVYSRETFTRVKKATRRSP